MKKYNVNGVEFFDWKGKPYCTIHQCGVEATYPFEKPKTEFPIQAVLMDLDGTTVISEEFWIYLIEKTSSKYLLPIFACRKRIRRTFLAFPQRNTWNIA